MKEAGECNRDSNGDVNSNNHTGEKGKGGGGDDKKTKTCSRSEEKKGEEKKEGAEKKGAEEAGPVAVVLNCAAGVSGSGTFEIIVTPPSGSTQSAAAETVHIACGSRLSVLEIEALESLLKVGSTVTIKETTPPTKGVLAVVVTATLTAQSQTIVINNAAQASVGGQTAGTVTITLNCAAGVTGAGTFEITVTPPSGSGASAATATAPISCGSSLTLSRISQLGGLLMVGSTFTINETTAPTNGVAAAAVTSTLSAENQTIVINNTAQASVGGQTAGTVSIMLTGGTGLTGAGTFEITVTPPSGSSLSPVTATVTIPVGSSLSLSEIPALKSLLMVGSTFTIKETVAPTNAVLASAVTGTLTTANQVIVINNVAQTAGTVTITLTGGTGVNGSGTFVITVTPPSSSGLSPVTVTVTIPVGSRLSLFEIAELKALLMVGSTVTLTETIAPSNAVLAAPVTFALTTGNLLITISASGTTSSTTRSSTSIGGGTSTSGGASTGGSGTTTTGTSPSSGTAGVTVTNSGRGSAATVGGLPQTGRAVLAFVLLLLAGLLLVFPGLLVMDLRKT